MKSICQFASSSSSLVSCLSVSLLLSVNHTLAQIEDPIPDAIERSNIILQIEAFTQIPASAGSAPLARINHLKPAGDGSGRLFVNDLNGILYLVSEDNASIYLDLGTSVSDLATSPGLGTGFTSFTFHPDFATNGKFYTAHMAPAGSGVADFTGPVESAPIALQGVILEWTANNPAANAFSGTNREILRIDLTHTIHGLQEISFNTAVDQADPDYGMLYICVGDSGATIQGFPENAHRLDSVLGTILRIDPMGSNSSNGQYGVPADNPWASDGDPTTFGEIWAYGFRNPHRISWDAAGDGKLLSGDIGERNIEEVNLIEPGFDYGWNLREGTFVINPDFDQNPQNGTRDEVFALPDNDDTLGFTYPVAQYDHDEGQAIVSGYVYRGPDALLMDGKFLFGDIVNGRLFAVDADSLAQGTQASIEELTLEFEGSTRTLLSIVSDSRVDLRFGYDEENELYLLEKRKGMVYKIAGARLASTNGGGSTSGSRLINISTRADVGTGDNVLIGGFIVGGTENKTVLIRAVGSELTDQGVADGTFLADPLVQIFSGGQVLATNDDWDADDAAGVTAAGEQVAGFQLVAGSKSSGLVIELAPGAYGAIVTGADGGTGICLIEVYEVENSN